VFSSIFLDIESIYTYTQRNNTKTRTFFVMDVQYGFPTLEQIIKFIRTALGNEALIEIKKKNSDIHIETASIRKDWDRIGKGAYAGFKKSDIGHSDLGCACSNWFDEYDVSKNLCTAFYPLILGWYRNLISSECLMTIPEFSTKRFVFRDTLEFLFNSYKDFPVIMDDLRLGKCIYKTIFSNVQVSLGLSSLAALYDHFDQNIHAREPVSISMEYGRTLERIVREDINPSHWEFFKLLLDVYPEQRDSLLRVYFVKNMKKAFEVVFGYTNAEWDCLRQLLNEGIDNGPFFPSLEHSFHRVLLNSFPPLITCNLVFVLNNLKGAFNSPTCKQYIRYLEEKAPHCSSFLIPWIDGYYEAKQGNLEGAVEKYRAAFAYRHMASDFSYFFLQQAIALVLYDSLKKEKDGGRGYSGRILKEANTYKEYFEVIYLSDSRLPKTLEEREIWFMDCFSPKTVQNVISEILLFTEKKIIEQNNNAMAVFY
jgi:hypothetical protein